MSEPSAAAADGRREASWGLALTARLARLLLGIFFRRVEVAGADKVPRVGPVVFVANHMNSLIDPALLIGFLDRRPRFLAKSTLWRQTILRPFLELGAAIPVYRRQDPGVDTSKNAETFARCHEVLRDGGAIALFPEGISHDQPGLVPLKTGVSRIVLEAEAKYGDGRCGDPRCGGVGTRIVPVGLLFDEKSRFRSRALVNVGEPLDPAPESGRYGADPRKAVGALTERVREALKAVTLNYPSWEEARLIERAAEIFARPAAELPAERRLSERFPLRQVFIAGYRELRERHGEAVARAAAAVREYDEQLEHLQLADAQVAASYPPSGVLRFVLKSLGLLLVRMPLAVVGTVLNFLPYRVVGRLAERGDRERDVVATYKVIGSMIFYPLTWLVIAIAAGVLWGLWAALGAAVLGPLSALVALRFHERRDYFLRQARAFLLLTSGRRSIGELRRRRGEVLRRVEELAELYRDGVPVQAPRTSAGSETRAAARREESRTSTGDGG
jgi:1-acyl-sn-glycerol-3-phosphate acyltransferase